MLFEVPASRKLTKAILPLITGAGVGVVPAFIDPAIVNNVAATVLAKVMIKEPLEFRKVSFAFMGWSLPLLPPEQIQLCSGLTDIIARHEARLSSIIRRSHHHAVF